MTKWRYERTKRKKKNKPSDKSNFKGPGRRHSDKARLVLVISSTAPDPSSPAVEVRRGQPIPFLPRPSRSACHHFGHFHTGFLSLKPPGGWKDERFHVENFNPSQPHILSRKYKLVLTWAELELKMYKGPKNHVLISDFVINVFDHKIHWPSWKKTLSAYRLCSINNENSSAFQKD